MYTLFFSHTHAFSLCSPTCISRAKKKEREIKQRLQFVSQKGLLNRQVYFTEPISGLTSVLFHHSSSIAYSDLGLVSELDVHVFRGRTSLGERIVRGAPFKAKVGLTIPCPV